MITAKVILSLLVACVIGLLVMCMFACLAISGREDERMERDSKRCEEKGGSNET